MNKRRFVEGCIFDFWESRIEELEKEVERLNTLVPLTVWMHEACRKAAELMAPGPKKCGCGACGFDKELEEWIFEATPRAPHFRFCPVCGEELKA